MTKGIKNDPTAQPGWAATRTWHRLAADCNGLCGRFSPASASRLTQIAGLFEIPFLGIRVVSNNITNGGGYDGRTGEACQEYVVEVVKRYISEKLTP